MKSWMRGRVGGSVISSTEIELRGGNGVFLPLSLLFSLFPFFQNICISLEFVSELHVAYVLSTLVLLHLSPRVQVVRLHAMPPQTPRESQHLLLASTFVFSYIEVLLPIQETGGVHRSFVGEVVQHRIVRERSHGGRRHQLVLIMHNLLPLRLQVMRRLSKGCSKLVGAMALTKTWLWVESLRVKEKCENLYAVADGEEKKRKRNNERGSNCKCTTASILFIIFMTGPKHYSQSRSLWTE